MCRLCLVLVFCLVGAASAAPLLSHAVGKQVNRAYALYEQNNLAPALEMLERLEPAAGFDLAYVNRFKATIYWTMGQTEKAVKALSTAVAQEALPEAEQRQVMQMLGDLWLSLEKPNKAIPLYQILIEQGVKEQSLFTNLAQAYYQLEVWKKVIPAAQQAIALAPEFGKQNHLLLLAGYYRLGDYRHAVEVLRLLTRHFPKEKRWWLQLAAAQMQLQQTQKAQASYELAYEMGLLDQADELKNLARLRAAHGTPMKAALLFERALDDSRLMADEDTLRELAAHWQTAREYRKAERVLGRVAAIRHSAKDYLQQADLLYLLGDYRKMLLVLAQVETENPDLAARTALARTHAHYELRDFKAALATAERALQFGTNTAQAELWIKMLQSRL